MLGYVLDVHMLDSFHSLDLFSLSSNVKLQEWFSKVEEISKEKAHIWDQLISRVCEMALESRAFIPKVFNRACGKEARLRSSHSFNRKNLEFILVCRH